MKELRYIGRFSDTEIQDVGYVKRGGAISVPDKLAEELLKRKMKGGRPEWELATKKTETRKGAKGEDK